PMKDEHVMQLPDRYRMEWELEAMNQKVLLLMVINGDKGWRLAGGAVQEIGKEEMTDAREELYVIWLSTLLPVKDKEFDLAPLPAIKVNGQDAVGVKVAKKGHPDVKLYFDKSTNLLVKVERRAREAGFVVNKEDVFSEHKSFDGIK